MQYQKIIEQLGYSRKEAKVYLASLRLGESHISDIATKVSMPRSTVQAIADRLHADGLMNFYIMRRYKYWVAARPEQLLRNLQKKEDLIQNAIPALDEMRKIARHKCHTIKPSEILTQIKVFVGGAVQAMLVADSEGTIEYVNTAWINLFGYTLPELQGKNIEMLISSQTSNQAYKELWGTISEQRLFQTESIIDQKKDGSCIRVKTVIFTFEHCGSLYYIQVAEELE